MVNRLDQSYEILEELRLPHGMYLASPSKDYSYVWLRDTFYEVLPYLTDDSCAYYEETYHRILDLLKVYTEKITYHTKVRPVAKWQYIHARYCSESLLEIDEEWGHAQHDSVGAVLFGIAEGIRLGKPIIRDKEDEDIIQMLVNYLGCCEYWHDEDNGMWEENAEVHLSSLGACVAGLQGVKELGLAHVPDEWLENGYDAIDALFPKESVSKEVDLAQLSLIYPYNLLSHTQARDVIHRVESQLVRERGVLRYHDDSYYSTKEAAHGRHLPPGSYIGTEAEWSMGYPWLALAYLTINNRRKASYYIKETERIMLDDGSLPELYYQGQENYNGNTPLGWANSLYILAKEGLDAYV